MPRSFAVALWLILAAPMPGVSSAAFAQASPVSEGPMGTPITPSNLGSWNFMPTISASEAARDARAQGFGPVGGLHLDDYGDWIADGPKGALIIFPDGRAYPL
jgi:hypothetical protein